MGSALLTSKCSTFAELVRFFSKRAMSFDICFWRTRDGEEIDFILEAGGRTCAIECKVGTPLPSGIAKAARLEELELSNAYVTTLTALNRAPWKVTEQWTARSPAELPVIGKRGASLLPKE